MAKKFLTSLDLNKNQLLNAVIHSLSSAPSSPVAGQIYYNTGNSTLQYYSGSAWITLAQGGDLTTAINNAINALDTDVIEEGANNLYFTDQRALNATASAYDAAGAAASAESNAASYTDTAVSAALANAYTYTNTIVDDLTTDDIEEGATNLYFTNARARTSISAGNTSIIYNSSTGAITANTAVLATQDNLTDAILEVYGTVSADILSASNSLVAAYTAADSTLSNNLTSAYQAADNAVVSSLTQDFQDADNVVLSTLRGEIAAAAQGLDVKESVRVATTANITLSGTQTIDGVSVAAGDRVLVKNQTSAAENGIYVVAAGAWSRAEDADEPAELNAGTFVFVEEGTTNADSGFVVSSNNPITIGTDAMNWVQFSGTGQITAGDGLTKSGSTLAVGGTTDRITVTADAVDIAATYVGQSSITTLGTITTGTWNGSTIDVAHGGTGATSFTAGEYLVGDGSNALTTVSSIPGSDISGDISGNATNVTGTVAIANGGTGATTAAGARANLSATTKYAENNTTLNPVSNTITWTVTHNINTTDVTVQMRDLGDGALVEADVVITNANTVTVSWYSAATVSADAYRVVVVG